MAEVKTKTTSEAVAWTSNLRPRVGDIVTYQGAAYSSVTGVNTTPGTSTDWKQVSAPLSRIIVLNGKTYELVKNPNNNTVGNELNVESNDYVINGFLASNVYLHAARFVSGDASNFGTLANNYTDGNYTDVEYSNW